MARKSNVLGTVHARRNQMGFSQEYMADELGLTQGQYSKIESGYSKVSNEVLSEIFDLLGLEVVPSDTVDKREVAHIVHRLFSNNESVSRIRSVIDMLDGIVKEYKGELDELGPHHFINEEEKN